MRLGEIGPARQETLDQRQRLVVPTALKPHDAERMHRLGLPRPGRQDLAVQPLGLGEIIAVGGGGGAAEQLGQG